MSIYFILLISTIGFPFMLSFDKKLQFYKQWPYLLPSICIVGAFYLLGDIYFTKLGVWGFNPLHHSGILLLGLPLEEWLFFLIIPYSSIFLHESLVLYFPDLKLGRAATRAITIFLILTAALVACFHLNQLYTLYICCLLVIALLLSLIDQSQVISQLYLTFIVILIPFIVLNGILTGTFIEQEVVWYNKNEHLDIRFLTIPIEDFAYGFSLILFNLMLKDKLKRAIKVKIKSA